MNSVRRIRYLTIALAKASLLLPVEGVAHSDGPCRLGILPRAPLSCPFLPPASYQPPDERHITAWPPTSQRPGIAACR
jgi:hypothetical protein